VHASLRADEGGIRDLGLARAAAREAEGSNSRYDDPEAVGMRPVLRTEALSVSYVVVNILGSSESIQIFLSSEGCRWRWARSAAPVPDSDSEAKTAGLVPPGGPLTRLRSAIMVVSEARDKVDVGDDAPEAEIVSSVCTVCTGPTRYLFLDFFALPFSLSPTLLCYLHLGLIALLNAERAFPR
jgi:hypothetical protein